MPSIQFMHDTHERRFNLLWNRLKTKQRQDASVASMLYLATGHPQVLERFSDYFFPDSGDFFDREFLTDVSADREVETIAQLIVQLYNGKTTVTVMELIDRLDEQQMSLVLEAIKLRAYGCRLLEKTMT